MKKELKPLIKLLESLSSRCLSRLPWNYRAAALLVRQKGWRYLLDVAYFIRKNTVKSGKILSLKLKDVVCIKKGKVGKENEFGRVFQLGRIVGNFLVAYTSSSLRMVDKKSLIPVIKEHQQLFGLGVLKSVTTDKGYYSHTNVKYVKDQLGNADGIQRPANIKDQVEAPQKQELFNRRAGVEPLIGHAKQFGLGKRQDEIRQGHFGFRVPLCHGLQLASINQRHRGPTGNNIGGLKSKSRRKCIENERKA